MTLLASHLDQISASSKTITALEFPAPKIFTNALLNNPEITTLIRDTEPHERALFSFDPGAVKRTRQQSNAGSKGLENGLHGRKSGVPGSHPMKQSAVSRALGNDMLREIRHSGDARHGGVNVEVLLRGAEMLCDVCSVAGAAEKIRALRHRHREISTSISVLSGRIAKQQSTMDGTKPALHSDDAADEDVDEPTIHNDQVVFTEDDLQLEEDEIRELETRKKILEDRVSGMQRDLGGLLT